MRHKGFSFATLLLLASMILAACGGGTTQAPTAAPAPAAAPTAAPAAEAPTAAPAAAPTAAPAAAPTAAPAGAAPTAAPAREAGSTIVVPQGLRTDLKGASIKAILGEEGPGAPFEDAMAKKFSDATGIQVQLIRGDRSATDRLATYRQQWASGSADVDVYQIDVIWPGIAAEFAEDLNPAFQDRIKDFFPAIAPNNP